MINIQHTKKLQNVFKSLRNSSIFFGLNIFLCLGAKLQVTPCVTTQKFVRHHINLLTQTSSLYTRELADFIKSIPALWNNREKVLNLTQENERLKEEIANLKTICKEQESLQKFLDTKSPQTYQAICRVVFSSSHPYIRSLVVNTTNQNVVVGQAVVTPDGLLGQIAEASEPFATVLLLGDSRSHIPVKIGEHAEGVLSGSASGEWKVHSISQIDTLSKGQKVTTLSDGKNIPCDIPIGTINSLNAEHATIAPYAKMRPSHVMLLPPMSPNKP